MIEEREDENQSTRFARHAEWFARNVDRKEVLKRGLVAAASITFLDRVVSARAADGGPVTAPDGTPLTYPNITDSPNCCCCSPACYSVTNPQGQICGCEVGCCYNPAHSGNACNQRFNFHSYPHYCWTCFIGSTKYVCCDYWCGPVNSTACICSRNCGTSGNCGDCSR